MAKPFGGKLKNWKMKDGRLYGTVIGDGRFADGDYIRTSSIEKITVETANTIYEINPDDKAEGE